MKTIAEKRDEVAEVNKANGWFDKEVTFGEAMALVHSEISEALEAFRVWGLDDATQECKHDPPPCLHKPEGVASEFADIEIRLLDYSYRFSIGLWDAPGIYTVSARFGENINSLHTLTAKASIAHADGLAADGQINNIYAFLRQLCAEYDVDLDAEYERKIAYNRTRGYRHGGKAL